MKVKAILWAYKPRQDGSCNIKIYVSSKGQKKYLKTDLHVHPKDWDEVGKVKNSHHSFKRINAILRKKIIEIEDHLLEGGDIQSIGNQQSNSLITYLEKFISESQSGYTKIKASTTKNYQSTLTRIKQYCQHTGKQDIKFEDVDLTFYNDFKKYLFQYANCSVPGFSKHVKILKATMNMALKENLHNNQVFRHESFKAERSNTNKIYLTEKEIEAIGKVDLSQRPGLEIERDRFLVSYYFLMRFEDSKKIRKELFFESSGQKCIKYNQMKTDFECVIPVKQNAWEILKKRDFNLDHDTNQEANRKLKTIAALAGINSFSKESGREGPKWQFVTTHTARRSAATNLALQNVNLKIIADLGGWKDTDTLRTYLRASGVQTAMVAKDLDFFN